MSSLEKSIKKASSLTKHSKIIPQKAKPTKNKKKTNKKTSKMSDSDDISLANSSENREILQKDSEIDISNSSSITIGFSSKPKQRKSSISQQIPKKTLLKQSLTGELEELKIKKISKSPKETKKLKKFPQNKEKDSEKSENSITKLNKKASKNDEEPSNMSEKKPVQTKKMKKLPIPKKILKFDDEISQVLNDSAKEDEKKQEIFMEGSQKINEEIDFDDESLQKPKRKRRTKKEMQLYNILQKALKISMETQIEQPQTQLNEGENEEPELQLSQEQEKTQKTPRKKRRTKKEMQELRDKEIELRQQLYENLESSKVLIKSEKKTAKKKHENNKNDENSEENNENKESMNSKESEKKRAFSEAPLQNIHKGDNDDLDSEFFSSDDKKDLMKAKKKVQEETQTKKENKGERKKNKKQKKLNSEFEEFLNYGAAATILNPSNVKSQKKRGRKPRTSEKIEKKKPKSPSSAEKSKSSPKISDSKASNFTIKEKKSTPKKRKKGGFIYYASNFITWNRVEPPKNNDISISKIDFEGSPGVKLNSLYYTTNPYDFFSLFMPEFMYEEISRFTNISASLNKDHHLAKNWENCNAQEIKDLFALFFLFELIKKHNLFDYWSRDPLLHISSIEKIMTQERFFTLKKFLSFYSKAQERDKKDGVFYKVNFLVNHILQSCSNIYTPEQNLFLQESLLNYEGILKNLSNKQRGKNEITIVTLKEVSSGYVCNALITEGSKVFDRKEILSIFKGLEFKGYTVFMESNFTTNLLLNDLKNKKILASGIILEKKMNIPLNLKKQINGINTPGETAFFKNKDLLLTIWKHYTKKIINLSNFEDYSMINIKKTRKIGYFSKVQYKIYEYDAPGIVYETIESLKGNDYLNRGMDYFSIDYNSWKWYCRVMLYFLEVSMMNSYLIYTKVLSEKKIQPLSNMEYRIEVIKILCKWNEKNEKKITIEAPVEESSLNNNINSDDIQDIIEDLGDITIKNNCKLVYIGIGFCQNCRQKRHKLKKTLFWCRECQYGLCLNCFDEHKASQIIKKLKEIDPKSFEKLSNLLILNQSLRIEEAISKKKIKKEKNRKLENDENKPKMKRTKTPFNFLRQTYNPKHPFTNLERDFENTTVKRKRKP